MEDRLSDELLDYWLQACDYASSPSIDIDKATLRSILLESRRLRSSAGPEGGGGKNKLVDASINGGHVGPAGLLPCPWPKCGGIADVHENGLFVVCRACGAEGPHCEDDGEAEIAWNSLSRTDSLEAWRAGEARQEPGGWAVTNPDGSILSVHATRRMAEMAFGSASREIAPLFRTLSAPSTGTPPAEAGSDK